jgi:hypothetical protein
MASEFPKNPANTDVRASGAGRMPPTKSTGVDVFEFGEPNQPPAGLMRKRSHIFLWILLALALGLLMAGFMVLVES